MQSVNKGHIHINKHHQTKHIQKGYRDIERRRRNKLSEKLREREHGYICALQNKWQNRKIENDTKKLMEAVEQNDIRPIWEYRKNLRANKRNTQKIHH